LTDEQFEAGDADRAALPPQFQRALNDAGIVDDHGTLRWVFVPGMVEVSSGGGTPDQRLFHLLQQVRYLVDEMHRKRLEAEAEGAALRLQLEQKEKAEDDPRVDSPK
jgi:hypothetical protein